LLIRFKARGLLVLAMAATGVRLLLLALFDSQTGILIFQLINGFTFPALWVAGVSYANENAPAGLSATAQAVFGTMIFGFGAAAGGFVFGSLWPHATPSEARAAMHTIRDTLERAPITHLLGYSREPCKRNRFLTPAAAIQAVPVKCQERRSWTS